MRKKVIAGNWKMNKTPEEAVEFVKNISSKINTNENTVIFCVPSICIVPVAEVLKGSSIHVGAQNMHFEDSGAFTGEISAIMLKNAGVKYVIIGHSERREYFLETDEIVNKKVIKAIENDLIPIVCVGETLIQREQGIAFDFIRMQIKCALQNISKEQVENIVIAYEPIWAIGTGKTATSQQAEEVCKVIRDTLSELYDTETANKIAIQYGGSVNTSNAKEIFNMPNIDGGLVGGASLKLDFVDIIL